ncbi:DEAD/DEAH box helicase [Dechloromonas sp.]|uniref:DEAD/DEAH box helicase n=1 Tax=Dechloromonas sp. TaxID=1917218 RepID=UPI0012297BF9|nr:DEAD/DEAH box helicase [Dechloromonas sp.]MBU3696966.1 DEAD/DEAH box helicase [Dechloromonas sp.]TEX49346.1 MAG: DEAD/DEAH box helicase [Rhodocyclaceae bacterium]
MSFADLGLSAPLLQALAQLGYPAPTPVQQQAIPGVLAGRDLMAAAQTGTGKTAAFALPLLQRLAAEEQRAGSNSIRALVLVPTRELAEQVMTSFRTYGEGLPVSCYAAYGGVSLNPQMMRMRRGVDILVATPGRLIDLFTKNAVKFRELQTLVLDEADRMLDLGFADDLDILFQALPKKRQTLLFSATFSDEIRSMAKARLRDPLSIEVSPRNTAAKTVTQWVVPCDKKRKTELFLYMRKDRGWGQVLVFVKTKKGCDELVGRLQAKQIAADTIHGDRPQASRLKALEAFKAGEVQILVATDVAARGLDIDDLPQVVNFDLPLQAEDYIHRIGRTGRAGASGEAISLVCADEAPLLAAIETLLKQTLSRDEEPGFEPSHRLPQTGPATGAPKPPKKPKTGGNRKVPGNWEGFDDFAAAKPKRPGNAPRPAGRAPRPAGKPRGR